MNRPIACCLLTAVCILVPSLALAQDQTPADEGNGLSKCDESYLRLYEKAHKAGFDVGRNRVDDGKLLSSGKIVQEPHPCELADRLDVMLNPPETTAVVSSTEDIASPPVQTSVGGCPASLAGESSSPTAVNPTSGAAGCIQAIPSTWAAYGGDTGYASAADAPVDVQMQVMQEICAAQGNDAWVAADPC